MDPVVVLALHDAAVLLLVGVAPGERIIRDLRVFLPPKHFLVKVPFECCVVACDDIRIRIGEVCVEVGEVVASGPVAVGSLKVQSVRGEAAKELKDLQLDCFRCERDKVCSCLEVVARSPGLQPRSQFILDPGTEF